MVINYLTCDLIRYLLMDSLGNKDAEVEDQYRSPTPKSNQEHDGSPTPKCKSKRKRKDVPGTSGETSQPPKPQKTSTQGLMSGNISLGRQTIVIHAYVIIVTRVFYVQQNMGLQS